MEEGSGIEAAKGKGKQASRSSLVALTKRDTKLDLSRRGNEKLEGERSVAMRGEEKAIGTSSVVEIDVENQLEHSGAAKVELMAEVSDVLGAKGKVSSGSWVVEMEMARWKQHCIYRVPEFIKKMTSAASYMPQFVSIGPLHHGEPHLLPMEEHKQRAVRHLVNRAGKPIQEFIAAINEVVDDLVAAYDSDLDDKWRGAKKNGFVEMMVADGCFLLELMRLDGIQVTGETDEDYAANDPIFSGQSFLDLWPVLRDDIICMENQIPLLVLQKLLAIQRGSFIFPEFVSSLEINYDVARLLDVPHVEDGMDNLGLHFLDIFHKSYCGIFAAHWEESDKYGPRTPCAIELSEAGIQFKRSPSNRIGDIHFESSMLSMPLLKLHGSTETIFLNLMAFEWLHPDAKREVRSYISFVDDLIESEEDVALLRSKGILENLTGSDRKVVDIFNTLTKLSRVPIRGSRLGHVQWKVNAHCKKRWNKWRATFVSTYLSTPWVFISLVAAVILLIATLLQTVYTILPFYKHG